MVQFHMGKEQQISDQMKRLSFVAKRWQLVQLSPHHCGISQKTSLIHASAS
jgi:hypothetical protein